MENMNENNIINFSHITEKANEIIYFNDGRMSPKSESKVYAVIQKVFIVFLIVWALGSLVFGEFLLAGESITVWICILIILGYLIKNGGHERVECPSELQFYDDYMIFFVPKCHVSVTKYQMESQKIYYKDVTKCQFRTNTRRMVICGMMDEVHFGYDKNGNVESRPNYQKHYDGMIYFYTVFDYEHDFKEIIERNTPLTVELQDA